MDMPAGVGKSYREAIGKAIAEARDERGMTQVELGVALGSSKNAVSNWERGQSAPTAESLRDLCHVLGVTPQRLLGMRGPRASSPQTGSLVDVRGLADQLVELREVAEKAVPDLMQALRDAEQEARKLAAEQR